MVKSFNNGNKTKEVKYNNYGNTWWLHKSKDRNILKEIKRIIAVIILEIFIISQSNLSFLDDF
jgi:hypothetical protein